VKILIVEDHQRMGQFLLDRLAENAYIATLVGSCAAALDALAENTYDLVILDLSLPDGDGMSVLRRWRGSGFNEPVLILSARDSLVDRVTGLDIGADDYLAKPFSFEELLARVRALLRRQSAVKQAVLERGAIRLDLIGHMASVNGVPIDLTNREFALLEIFMQNAGRVLTRTLIAEKIWPSPYDVDTNLLDVYMSRLRTKLEVVPGRPVFKTVRGVGYQLL
jgi:DNA-binding response OmpR family regulator